MGTGTRTSTSPMAKLGADSEQGPSTVIHLRTTVYALRGANNNMQSHADDTSISRNARTKRSHVSFSRLGGLPRPRTNDGVMSLIEHASCADDRTRGTQRRYPLCILSTPRYATPPSKASCPCSKSHTIVSTIIGETGKSIVHIHIGYIRWVHVVGIMTWG